VHSHRDQPMEIRRHGRRRRWRLRARESLPVVAGLVGALGLSPTLQAGELTCWLRTQRRRRRVWAMAVVGPAYKLCVLALTGMLASSALMSCVEAAAGDLDPTFGLGGKVTTDFFGNVDFANAVAVQPDGKIVAAGQASFPGQSVYGLARYNSDGSLDSTFGSGGLVTTAFGQFSAADAVVLQPDGKIVAAGSASSGGFGLARYNSDGSLDSTFGVGGRVTTDFFGGGDAANAVVLQPDGKIIAAGAAFTGQTVYGLARYNSDGSLDPTFGSGGLVTTAFGQFDIATAVVLQPDGKIVAAGRGGPDFTLARYNSDGSLDSTFGVGGRVTTDFFGNEDGAWAMALQPDGKIVAAGFATRSGEDIDFALARYNSDGSLDPTFGLGGKVTTDFFGFADPALAVVLQPDGKIVAAGQAAHFPQFPPPPPPGNVFGLARYNSDGSLDPTFGSGGLVTTAFSGFNDHANAMALQPDGKIVAAGYTEGHPLLPTPDFALARYLSTGIVTDTIPPAITVSAGPATLWPPNGKLVPVTVSGTITDNEPGGSGVNASSAAYVVADEYGQVQPSGSIMLGADGRYAFTIALQASRDENDQDGRHYVIIVSAKDNAGNLGASSTIVTVPHDQGQ
jgi:uncharacterized delta-60 repeat protein